MDKTVLVEQMKVILASAFSFYLKAHNYHWNVTGSNFPVFHSFFGDVYTEVHSSIDIYAEHIRALGSLTPGSLSRYLELSKVSDENNVPTALGMVQKLATDNRILLSELRAARSLADGIGEYGIVNFLEGRIDAHEKMQWKLDAFKEVI